MRPGSAEIIEHYRQLAERGEPLTPDPGNIIPMLPGEDNALRRLRHMDMSNLNQAIDRILSDEGEQHINRRIEELEVELAKLKKLQRALQGKSGSGRTLNFKVDTAMEAKVVAFIKSMALASQRKLDSTSNSHPSMSAGWFRQAIC